jgi:uncharacterized repeat protein (TIGR03803 family)
VIQDAKGNLYGTASYGGTDDDGVVFKVVPKTHTETVLYSFTGSPDGASPDAGLMEDAKGNLYGTTPYGGSSNCYYGCGVVYEVPKAGGEKVLYNFTGGADGAGPYAGLILDTEGNLYGTTEGGGADGGGAVFELTSKGKEKVLYSFTGSRGNYPLQGLLAGKGFADLFGSTYGGGAYGNGTVYKLVVKTGKETVLHSFEGNGMDGANPNSGYLVQDTKGNLYGTTGGNGAYGYGTVFKVNEKTGTETILYNFIGGSDGGYPEGSVVLDKKGNLYGTTVSGGAYDDGTVFKLTPGGTETVLHSFDGSDGAYPLAAPLAGRQRQALWHLQQRRQ